MGRRTGDETRALLLRVGMQMLLERGVSAGVQHIRLQEVLRRRAGSLRSGQAIDFVSCGDVEVEVVPGVFHGFEQIAPRAAVTRRFLAAQCASLHARLGV